MTVTRADLDTELMKLRASVTDPRAGIYGPGSASWRIDKESILFLGGGKAALLQLAHPFVAHAIDQHSDVRHDPLKRFQRTFESVFGMVFGDLAEAERAARRVHAVHSRIFGAIGEDVGAFARGHPYEANDEAALLWVYATLVETSLQVYDLIVRPLDYGERDRYYGESKRFARLFGIPDRVLPQDWAAFRNYYRQMIESPVIRVGAPARELSAFLFTPPHRAQQPLFRWAEVMTAGLLTERLRNDFGLRWGQFERLVFRSSISALSAAYPKLPKRLRYTPAYIAARWRLDGKRGPDRVGRALELLAALSIAGNRPRRRAIRAERGARSRERR